MSIRQNQIKAEAGGVEQLVEQVQAADATLGEGNSFNVVDSDHPLKRSVVVSIKASLNDLCLQKQRATWQPSQEALKSIFQQRKFTSLDGSAEPMGDLKSIVLHGMELNHVKSTFPMSLGARVTGVDDATFTATGEPFSSVILPNSESNVATALQADDVSLAYEFVSHRPCPCLGVPAPLLQVADGLPRVHPSAGQEVPGIYEREPEREGRARGLAAALCAGRGRPPHRVCHQRECRPPADGRDLGTLDRGSNCQSNRVLTPPYRLADDAGRPRQDLAAAVRVHSPTREDAGRVAGVGAAAWIPAPTRRF